MGLREDILSRRGKQKLIDVAVSSKGHAYHNVPEFGIVVAEDVETEEDKRTLPADEYFHAERKAEIKEYISLADMTLVDGEIQEHAAFSLADIAHGICDSQIRELERLIPEKRLAYAQAIAEGWEREWDHGK